MSFGRDSDPRFGAFTARAECPGCGGPVPVNAPVEAVVCGACGRRLRVPGKLLRDLLDAFEEGWPRPPGGGTTPFGDTTWRTTAHPVRAAVCSACQEVLPVDWAVDGSVMCRCGAGASVGSMPGPLAAAVPSARRVVRAAEPAPQVGGEPLTLNCPQCGAGVALRAADDALARCTHCDAQVAVPEALWRALHPVRPQAPWTVRFEGPSRRTQAAAEAEARRAAEAAEAHTRRSEAEARAAAEAAAAQAAREAAEAVEAEARRAELLRLAEELRARRRLTIAAILGAGLLLAGGALLLRD